MSDKGKLYTIALAILLAVGFIGFGMFLGYNLRSDHFRDETKMIDTIVVHDTIKVENWDTITEQVTRYKLVQVDFHDTIVRNDTTFVELPLTQKHYHEDSVCDIWISGYEPNLDSANIIKHERTIIERHYIAERERNNIIGLYSTQNAAGGLYLRSVGNLQVGGMAAYRYDKSGVEIGLTLGYKF